MLSEEELLYHKLEGNQLLTTLEILKRVLPEVLEELRIIDSQRKFLEENAYNGLFLWKSLHNAFVQMEDSLKKLQEKTLEHRRNWEQACL